MEGAIFGRDAVLTQAWQALAAGGRVMIEGPPGIGKTAVWGALLDRAKQLGWLVLSCAPTETEASLALAALGDLLQPLADQVTGLPAPQRLAAEAALLLSSDMDGAVDGRALGGATRSLLETAVAHSADGNVLVAVDDAPWLDPSSERALRFALRRIPKMSTLVTCRPTGTVPLGLDETRLTRITLEPLGVGAINHAIRDRLDATLSRPLLTRVATEACGNPLLAIELARAIQRLPCPPMPGEDLPIAASIQAVLTDTLATLPTSSRDAVRLAALLSVPSPSTLAAAGVSLMDLEPAEEAGVLSMTPTAVEFAHPMYATAVRAAIPPGVRRRLHARLAEVVADPDERARQLAQSIEEPDLAVAGELADAGRRQRCRGAAELACQMYERAAQLTPASAQHERGRWRLDAALSRYDSGDYRAAGAQAAALAAELDGQLRAESLLLCAVVAWNVENSYHAAARLARLALAAATSGSTLEGHIHAHLSLFCDDPVAGRRHAEAACALLSAEGTDRKLLASSLFHLFFQEVRLGLPARTELLDRAIRLEDGRPSWLSGTVAAIWWKGIDDHSRARDRLNEMLRWAAASGDESLQYDLIRQLGHAELLAGRYPEARAHIVSARELGAQLGTGQASETWLAALLDAHEGELGQAGAAATAGLRHADEIGDDWCRRINLQLSAFVALCEGRMRDAAAHYGELAAGMDAMSLLEPLSQRIEPDWIEACIGAGDLDTARMVYERLEARHRRLPRPWTTLGLARSKVLLDGAAGDGSMEGLDGLTAALDTVPAEVLPFDRARCLLVAGLAHRRARRKREARTSLLAAADEFGFIGAKGFAMRARQEAARTGGRASDPHNLTATEAKVAALAAMGSTNRAIADALFISHKTVEANLARVYSKLGISSRAQLGAVMVERQRSQT